MVNSNSNSKLVYCYNIRENIVGTLAPNVVTILICGHFTILQECCLNIHATVCEHCRSNVWKSYQQLHVWKFELDMLSRHICIIKKHFYSNIFTSRNFLSNITYHVSWITGEMNFQEISSVTLYNFVWMWTPYISSTFEHYLRVQFFLSKSLNRIVWDG